MDLYFSASKAPVFQRNQTEVEHLVTARLDTSSSKRRVEEAAAVLAALMVQIDG